MVHDLGRHRRRSMSRAELVGAWVADRLPLAVRGRVTLGGRELGLVALVGALGLCAVAVVALRSSAATATPVKASAVVHAPLVRTARSAATVVVDVSGAVLRPGVVTLPTGSRVSDALKAAGGPRRGIDVAGLNLARVLVDGEQIIVGGPSPSSTSGSRGGSALVSLNQATEAELDALPGVGPVTAKSIVTWRQQHGSFTRVEELEEIDGIGPKTFAKLKPLVGL